MSLKKVMKDFGYIGASRVILSLSGLFLLPVLTKNIGAKGYGLYIQATVTINLATRFLGLGAPYSVQRLFPGKEIKQISKDFYSLLGLVSLISGIFSFLLLIYPSFLSNLIFEDNDIVVRLVALIIFVWSVDKIFILVFRAFREMKIYSIINISKRFSEVGLAIAFVLILGYGVVGALISLLIIRLLLLFVLMYLISRKLSFRIPKLSRTREYLNIGIPTIPSSLSHWIVSTSDRYLIGFFLGSTFVGYYSPAYTLGKMVPWMIAGILAFILLPNLSNFYEEDELKKTKRTMDLSLRFFLTISLPYFFGAIILGKDLLTLLSTPQIAKEGSIIIPFIALTGVIYGFIIIFGQIINLKKKTKYSALVWFIASIVNFGGNIILVPMIGIIGAAITTVASYTIAFLLTLYISLEILGFDLEINYKPIAKSLISSIIMASIVLSLKIYVSINPLILVLIGIFIYFGVLWLIGGISEKEINFLKNQVSNK